MKSQQTVLVWDLFVRIFHWSLALLVGLAFLTGDDASSVHVYVGYATALLIVLRLIWGIIGSRQARLTQLIASPGAALGYLKSMLRGTPKHYLGHNPAAAFMVLALLLTLLLVNATGYLALPSQDSQNVAADFAFVTPAWADEDEDDNHLGKASGSEFWKDVHEAGAGLLLGLIGVHIFGALASSLLHRENLVKSMFTGRKIRRE